MTPSPGTIVKRAGVVEDVTVTTLEPGVRRERRDSVAGEEPLEIRVGGPSGVAEQVATTMRTPGNDFELAVGFLLSEGLLEEPDDLRTVRYCDLPEGDPQRYNVVTVTSRRPVHVGDSRRNVTVSASCGVCGTANIDRLRDRCPPTPGVLPVDTGVLVNLPAHLRDHQRVFDRTGGLHAAGLFDATGRLLVAREDIGRHNAVDKLVGWAAMGRRLPLSTAVLVVSGRVSFEIVQKAAVAGVPVLVAVSAASSLAVSTARDLGMTLVGFVRDGHANVYSAPWRVEDGGQ